MNISEILHRVFTVNYIFDFNSIVLNQGDRLYMVVGLLMVLLGSAFKLISNYSTNSVKRMFYHRLASPLVVGGILEVLWYSARYENIKLFGSHFSAWIAGIAILVWISFPIRYFFTRYKSEWQSWEKQQIKLKYLKR